MVSITCKNHPKLRWSCKEMAWTNGGYNGCRGIFFFGAIVPDSVIGSSRVVDGELVVECDCPNDDLMLVPKVQTVDAKPNDVIDALRNDIIAVSILENK